MADPARAATPPDRPCARYFGSDGTLCATHNGRFPDDVAMRCDRRAIPERPAEPLDVEFLARWLHDRRFGCVSGYGTDVAARAAYDKAGHLHQATLYASDAALARATLQSTPDTRLHKVGCTIYPAAHDGFCPTPESRDE